MEHAHKLALQGFPRVCGDVPTGMTTLSATYLFSPRMRGCSALLPEITDRQIVFPAYAGMFPLLQRGHTRRERFPRVCGDVPGGVFYRNIRVLFSPRMRGCSSQVSGCGCQSSVFPAYAGMFLPLGKTHQVTAGFPRVCGDVPRQSTACLTMGVFSPRMRGCSYDY